MLKRFFKKLNNKAFTLIEILLAVGLLAIASVSIGAIIISTQNNTNKMFSESELQQQMVAVQEALHNEILATSEGIGYWSRDTKTSSYVRKNVGDPDAYEQIIAFYNLDTKDYILNKTYYKWNSEEKTLHTATITQEIPRDTINDMTVEVDKNLAPAFSAIGENWSLVASNVETMSVNLSTYGKNRLVSFNMEIKQGDSVYPIDDTIYIRNTIDVNQDMLTIEKYHTIKLPKPTLENTVFVYDGKSHAPTEIDYLERYLVRTDNSTLVAKDAGTYVVTYQLKDKDGTQWEDGTTADVTLVWVIQQRVVGLVWGETTWIYDGQTHHTTCRATNVVEGDSCEIKLANNSVGPHVQTVTCTAVSANPNYVVPNLNTVVLKIQKAQPTMTIQVANKTYNGSAQSMVAYSNVVGGTPKFYISTSSTTPATSAVSNSSCQATNAGTYHIWYRLIADNSGDYSDTDVFYLGTATMSRSKTATASGKSLVYNDATQTGVTGAGVNWSGATTGKNAGTYNAYATPDANHLWSNGGSEQRTVTWTIDKATGHIVAPTAKTGLVYNGSAQTLVNAGSTKYGSVYYKVGSGSYSAALPKGTNAGTYTISYYSIGDANHYPTSAQSFTVTIARQRTAYANGKSLTYNGSAQNGVDAANVTLSGTQSATVVGTYQFKATPTSNYAWSDGGTGEKTVTWYITKKAGSVTKAPTAKTLVYNGADQQLVNAGTTSTGTMYYSLNSSSGFSTSIPTGKNAGTYTVYYYSVGDSNHSDTAKGSVQVTIARKPSSTASAVNRVYSGSSQTGVTGGYVNWTGTTSATNYGTYTAYATPQTNYCWSNNSGTETRTITWTISKAAGSVTPPTAKSIEYDGNSHVLINAGSSTTGTMYYKLSGGSYSTSLPSATNAGTYTVYYYSKGDANHNNTAEASITVTITRRPTQYVTVANRNYTGSAQNGYSAKSSMIELVSGNMSATNVGSYSFTMKLTSSNYAWKDGTTANKTFSWKISAVAASVTKAPTAKSLTYTGSAQALVNAGTASGGTMKYCLTSNGTFSTTIPTGTAAGDYTVYYFVDADGNHTDTSVQSVKVTIGKSKTASASASNKEYNNGSTLTGVTGTNVDLSGTCSAVNVGSYTAYATPKTNYAWSDGTTSKKTLTWKITPRPTQSVTKADRTYNGGAQNGYSSATSMLDWSGTYSATNAGTYTFTCTPKANYAWTDGTTAAKSFTWTMSRKRDASASVSNKTYNGSAQDARSSNANVSWSGTYSATNAGTHTAYATPTANHAWSDGGTGQKTLSWTMARLADHVFTVTNHTYDGNGHYGYDGSKSCGYACSWEGTWYAVDAGTYTYKMTPDANHAWNDGSTGAKTFTWYIYRNQSAWASGSTNTYNGSSITGVSGGYVSWSGTTSTSSAGTHTAYATPTANYAWPGGGTETRAVTWTINGYLYKSGSAAVTRSTCKVGCSKNGIYNSAGAAAGHSGKVENLSTDLQTFTVAYIYTGSYQQLSELLGPVVTYKTYALHPKNNFYHPTTGGFCTGAGWVPAENCEGR